MTAITIKYDESNKVMLSLLATMEAAGAILSRTRKVKEDPTLMTKEEFYAKLDRASEQAANGQSVRFNTAAEACAYMDKKTPETPHSGNVVAAIR